MTVVVQFGNMRSLNKGNLFEKILLTHFLGFLMSNLLEVNVAFHTPL